MTCATEPAWTSSARNGVVASYEALRERVLTGWRDPAGASGWALLARRGMSEWIRAWRALVTTPTPRDSNEAPMAMGSALSPTLHGDVTRLLATMALEVFEEPAP